MSFQYVLHNRVGLMKKRGLSDNIHDDPQEAGDMNCHIGSKCDGFEDVMGCLSFGVRKQEEENMLGLCQEHNLRVMNSYRKRQKHLTTCKSGENESQIAYVLCRRHEELKMKNCKVIPGEACLTQHRLR